MLYQEANEFLLIFGERQGDRERVFGDPVHLVVLDARGVADEIGLLVEIAGIEEHGEVRPDLFGQARVQHDFAHERQPRGERVGQTQLALRAGQNRSPNPVPTKQWRYHERRLEPTNDTQRAEPAQPLRVIGRLQSCSRHLTVGREPSPRLSQPQRRNVIPLQYHSASYSSSSFVLRPSHFCQYEPFLISTAWGVFRMIFRSSQNVHSCT